MEPKKQHVVLIRMELILLSSVMMVIIIRLIFLEKRVIVKLFLKKVSNEYVIFNDIELLVTFNIKLIKHRPKTDIIFKCQSHSCLFL